MAVRTPVLTRDLDLQLTPTLQAHRWRYHRRRFHQYRPFAHPDIELAWIESGRVSYQVGRDKTMLTAGELFVVPATIEHATGFADSADGCSIKLDPTMVASVADVLGPTFRRRQIVAGVVREPDTLLTLARMIHAEATNARDGHLMAGEALGEALTIELLRRASPSDAPRIIDPKILAVLRFIERSYQQTVSVEELAKVAGMSRYHFSRRFREVVGQSPYQHLLETRLGKAAELLRGHHGVTEAALAAGFTELGRFGRMFRKWSGQSPTAYQNAHRRSQTAAA